MTSINFFAISLLISAMSLRGLLGSQSESKRVERNRRSIKLVPGRRQFCNSFLGCGNGRRSYVELNSGPDELLLRKEEQSNISQSEYAFKHRLLFETSRRNKLKRLRERGETTNTVPKKSLRVFTPIVEKSRSSFRGVTREFAYSTNIGMPGNYKSTENSITEVEDAEIRFLLIPTRCSHSRQVTFSIMEETTTLEVDACRVRWDSLSVPRLGSNDRTRLTVTCTDCAAKGVTYSSPYLNVITTVAQKRFSLRSGKQISPQERPLCARKPLKIRFKDIPSYELFISPQEADIGICSGQCKAPVSAHNNHAILHYALFRKGIVNKRPCCAPYEYEDLEYLYENGTKLVQGIWENAIAVSCTCQ